MEPQLPNDLEASTPIPDKPSLIRNFTEHRYAPIIITAIMLILLFITTAFIAYHSSRPEEAATTEATDDTPVPTAALQSGIQMDINSWKTYTDDEYGFSLKYRPDLNYDLLEDQTLWLKSDFINDPYENNFNMSIKFETNTGNSDPIDLFEERCENPRIPTQLITEDIKQNCFSRLEESKQEYTVGNITGVRAPVTNYESAGILTVIPYDEYLVRFYLGGSGEAGSGPSEIAIETYDKILSSFEFKD